MHKRIKSVINATRSGLLAGGAAVLAIGAMGFAGAAQARDNVSFSVGIGVPGLVVGASNAYPVYTQPVYAQPVYSQPVYVQPRPVYVQPAPVYVQPAPVYYQNAPVYYGRPHGHGHHGGGYYVQAPRPAYAQGYVQGYGPGYHGQRYAPVYYQR
jgi:PXPV repeat (3 copies)